MRKFKELTFEDLIGLLKTISGKKLSEDEEFTPLSLGSFFPSMTASEELEFSNLCEDIMKEEGDPEKEFNSFKERHPEIEVDPSGTSIPKKRNYWEIGLQSMELSYATAKNFIEKTNGEDSLL